MKNQGLQFRCPIEWAFVALSSLAIWSGCEREKLYVLPHTEKIFPTQVGATRISYVEDTTFTSAGLNDPSVETYFKREELGGSEPDLNGRPLQRINVYRSPVRFDSSYSWSYDRLWTQYFEPQPNGTYYAERTEQNQRIRVLRFPVYPGVTWNGNLFNTLGPQEFYYAHVDTTVLVRGKTYLSCVMVVQQADTAGFINDKFAYEIYAPEIGLVKRYHRSLVFDGPNGEFNPDLSYIYREEIADYLPGEE